MTWHWSFKSLPELAGLPDDERRRVVGVSWRKARRECPALWLVTPAAWVVGVVLYLHATFPPSLGTLPALLAGCLIGFGTGQVEVRAARPYLLRELPGRCRGCGYDLTGNASGACPECGRAAAV